MKVYRKLNCDKEMSELIKSKQSEFDVENKRHQEVVAGINSRYAKMQEVVMWRKNKQTERLRKFINKNKEKRLIIIVKECVGLVEYDGKFENVETTYLQFRTTEDKMVYFFIQNLISVSDLHNAE